MSSASHVWLVEVGRYSDYHVAGVFSSHAAAVFVADRLDDATVSYRTLDPGFAELSEGLAQHIVHMRRDGTVETCRARGELSAYALEGETSIWARSRAPAYAGTDIPDVLTATVWAKDETHAIKIVNERRGQMIATGEWPAP